MDKVAVAAFGSAALAVAAAVSLRWARLDQSFRAGGGHPIARALRRLVVIEVSGLVAGFLVGGLGSRLMMRIMAATSPAAAQGQVTAAGEIVGRVTQEGTGGLIIFVGLLFGLLGAVIYAVIGQFLPRRSWVAGLLLGLLVLGVFARRDPLSPENRDFQILSPVALAVAMIVVLFLLYGTTVVAVAARLERFYPQFDIKRLSVAAYAPLLLLGFPPFTLALLAAVFIGALNAQFPDLPKPWRTERVRTAGFAVLVIGAVVANIWLGFGIAEIL